MKIRIARTDLADSMLTHKDGGVSVVEQIAREVRNLCNDLFRDPDMSFRGDQNTEARRSEKRRDEVPCCQRFPRLSHHARMGGNPQELIQNGPGRVPCFCVTSLALKPVSTSGMERRISVSRIHQNIGVNNEHYRPSMA